MARLEKGEWAPEGASGAAYLEARRPNIFNLYEQNVGLIQSAILAEELMDAESTVMAKPVWIHTITTMRNNVLYGDVMMNW